MAFVVADRVREQVFFAGGTGAVTLAVSAVASFQTFLNGWGASGTGWYCISAIGGLQWETGLGTLNAGGTTLTRTTVFHGSSGTGVPVSFSAGTLDCFGALPAATYGYFQAGINLNVAEVSILFNDPSGTNVWFVGKEASSSDRFVIGAQGAGYWLTVAKTTGVVAVLSATASSGFTTGALTVAGGLGVGGAIFSGGGINTSTSSAGNSGFFAQNNNAGTSAAAVLRFQTDTGISSFLFFTSSTYTSYGGASSLNLFTDSVANIAFCTNAILRGYVAGDGGLVWGAPTGGSKGVGTINTSAAYYVGGNQVAGARVTGYTAMTGSPDKATSYATSTVTLAQLAGRVAQLQADLTTHGLISA